MYSKPQMLTHLEYSSTSHNSQPTPIGIRDPVHCATYTRPCFPLRSRPIPYNSYRCPLVYSSDMPWTSRIVIPEMTWWSDILASLLLSSAWDPNHQLLPDPWWRNIVFEFFLPFFIQFIPVYLHQHGARIILIHNVFANVIYLYLDEIFGSQHI